MKVWINLILVFLLGFVLLPASAEIFKWVDDQGNVHFTDKPPETAKTEKVKVEINSFTSPTVAPFNFDPSLISRRKTSTDVVMYSAVWCGYCKKARRYFQANSIPFEEYDIEKSSKGKRDYKKLNGRGVPIILVGDRRMDGFSESSFNKIYQR